MDNFVGNNRSVTTTRTRLHHFSTFLDTDYRHSAGMVVSQHHYGCWRQVQELEDGENLEV
eukprot:6185533-Pleurochrysis_carterae.AAC.1